MLASGYGALSQSPAPPAPSDRKTAAAAAAAAAATHINKANEQPTTSDNLEQRMQYMIDMQNAFTDSFREGGEQVPPAPPTESGMDTSSSANHHYQSGQQDPTVGKGQIIFSNNYYEQQQQQQPQTHQQQQLLEESQQPLYYNTIIEQHQQPIHHDYNNSSPKATDCCWHHCLEQQLEYWNAENLHRSFCYGAIDGMLTGAGLVATLQGFGFISSGQGPQPWLIAVTFVACTADALCMALGHVWSTHVLSTHAAQERRDERQAFTSNRDEAKAKLVDLLLSRGMLKIDAVSIADTLEGYPDIFVGALVGDAVVLHDTNPVETHTHTLSDSYSYGQFNEWDHDPDAASVFVAVAESQTEAIVMFLAFSIFGSLPAVLYYGVSQLEAADQQQGMSARSAAMTLTCICMWCLGIWKRYVFVMCVIRVCVCCILYLVCHLLADLPRTL